MCLESIATYLQVISILVGVVAVIVPLFIIFVAFVYVKQFKMEIEELSSKLADTSIIIDKMEENHKIEMEELHSRVSNQNPFPSFR